MRNQYPRWKYFLLFAVMFFSLLYALPNIYGDDPSLQISATAGAKLTPAIEKTVKKTLQQANLSCKSMRLEAKNLLMVRFRNTDIQLAARKFIRAALNDNYTVALNLAPSTPAWLRHFNAKPMKLGLDLRGGVHFLLYVDAKATLAKRTQDDVRRFGQELRKAKIRYFGLRRDGRGGAEVNFRTAAAQADAISLLRRSFPNFRFERIKQADKFSISAILSPAMLTKERQAIVDQTITVLRNRINALGVSEPVIQQQGQAQVSIDLPGIQDATEAKRIIGGTATLEFHLVDEQHDLSSAVAGDVPVGSRVYYKKDGTPVLLQNQIILKGSSITGATSSFGQDGRPVVNIRASGPGVSFFTRTTAENVGKLMAIVYVETKTSSKLEQGKIVSKSRRLERVINVARIQSALPNSFQITGLDSPQLARSLALQLRSGALPATISYLEESMVGPSLGKDNIEQGALSVQIGFVLIVFFMAVYYRVFGLIANLALLFNLVILVAVLSLIGAVLTLPGIAGMLLTIGMAVDANVLIFERIREELRNGMSTQASIHAGYEKAFATIVDSNVTTLIAAVALFSLGSGAIKGFAITLTIGLLTSMLTSITGTRAIVNLIYGHKPNKQLSIGIKV